MSLVPMYLVTTTTSPSEHKISTGPPVGLNTQQTCFTSGGDPRIENKKQKHIMARSLSWPCLRKHSSDNTIAVASHSHQQNTGQVGGFTHGATVVKAKTSQLSHEGWPCNFFFKWQGQVSQKAVPASWIWCCKLLVCASAYQ